MNREEMEKEVAKEFHFYVSVDRTWRTDGSECIPRAVFDALVTARLKISELDSALAKRETEDKERLKDAFTTAWRAALHSMEDWETKGDDVEQEFAAYLKSLEEK